MARKRYKPEEIVAKLRQIDVLVSRLTADIIEKRASEAGGPPAHDGSRHLTPNRGADRIPDAELRRYARGPWPYVPSAPTEHVLDQRNAFKMIHDFTRAGGLMLHALPFTVHLEHGLTWVFQLSAKPIRCVGAL
jgi:hypothetical protein